MANDLPSDKPQAQMPETATAEIWPGPEPTRDQLLDLARKGKEAWNAWRAKYPKVVVDFSGVDFRDAPIKFSRFHFGDDARFEGATFGGSTRFEYTTFGDEARFKGATFGEDARFTFAVFGNGVQFDGATFKNRVRFDNAIFNNSAHFVHVTFGSRARFRTTTFGIVARFDGTTFGDRAHFVGASFGDRAHFDGVVFGAGARLFDTTFGDDARFGGATFGPGAHFDRARFGQRAHFHNARFGQGTHFDRSAFAGFARFDETRFGDYAHFHNASFGHMARFDCAIFAGAVSFTDKDANEPFKAILFSHARFEGVASFAGRRFEDETDFSWARFRAPPEFGTEGEWRHLHWTGTRFGLGGRFPFRDWTTDPEIPTRLRRLRRIAAEIRAHDAERDLFILERKAERGIFWDEWRIGKKCDDTLLFHALGATTLMAVYSALSNCGRSIARPLAWLIAANLFFGWIYGLLAVQPKIEAKVLFAFTMSHLLPFFGVAREAYEKSVEVMFGGPVLPTVIQALAWGQGVLNGLLIFLLGLAIRNHFRVGS